MDWYFILGIGLFGILLGILFWPAGRDLFRLVRRRHRRRHRHRHRHHHDGRQRLSRYGNEAAECSKRLHASSGA